MNYTKASEKLRASCIHLKCVGRGPVNDVSLKSHFYVKTKKTIPDRRASINTYRSLWN